MGAFLQSSIADKKIAIFIDLVNINESLQNIDIGLTLDFDTILERIQESGHLIIGKCYMKMYSKNEYESMRLDGFLNKLSSLNIEPVFCPYTDHKSLSDPMLITDAMECLCEKSFIDTFILVTSDKDVTPLMQKIIGKGKDCIILGIESNTSPYLIKQIEILGGHFEEVVDNFTRTKVRPIYHEVNR
ncbi:MAG: hypothetical protein A2047_01935 [Omnitrophica bacterium GWA2_41_15]|nr:MAG: hypothetical protein A2047_01935 [Omnitrophica bacterium GWA2_41_15]